MTERTVILHIRVPIMFPGSRRTDPRVNGSFEIFVHVVAGQRTNPAQISHKMSFVKIKIEAGTGFEPVILVLQTSSFAISNPAKLLRFVDFLGEFPD